MGNGCHKKDIPLELLDTEFVLPGMLYRLVDMSLLLHTLFPKEDIEYILLDTEYRQQDIWYQSADNWSHILGILFELPGIELPLQGM